MSNVGLSADTGTYFECVTALCVCMCVCVFGAINMPIYGRRCWYCNVRRLWAMSVMSWGKGQRGATDCPLSSLGQIRFWRLNGGWRKRGTLQRLSGVVGQQQEHPRDRRSSNEIENLTKSSKCVVIYVRSPPWHWKWFSHRPNSFKNEVTQKRRFDSPLYNVPSKSRHQRLPSPSLMRWQITTCDTPHTPDSSDLPAARSGFVALQERTSICRVSCRIPPFHVVATQSLLRNHCVFVERNDVVWADALTPTNAVRKKSHLSAQLTKNKKWKT